MGNEFLKIHAKLEMSRITGLPSAEILRNLLHSSGSGKWREKMRAILKSLTTVFLFTSMMYPGVRVVEGSFTVKDGEEIVESGDLKIEGAAYVRGKLVVKGKLIVGLDLFVAGGGTVEAEEVKGEKVAVLEGGLLRVESVGANKELSVSGAGSVIAAKKARSNQFVRVLDGGALSFGKVIARDMTISRGSAVSGKILSVTHELSLYEAKLKAVDVEAQNFLVTRSAAEILGTARIGDLAVSDSSEISAKRIESEHSVSVSFFSRLNIQDSLVVDTDLASAARSPYARFVIIGSGCRVIIEGSLVSRAFGLSAVSVVGESELEILGRCSVESVNSSLVSASRGGKIIAKSGIRMEGRNKRIKEIGDAKIEVTGETSVPVEHVEE